QAAADVFDEVFAAVVRLAMDVDPLDGLDVLALQRAAGGAGAGQAECGEFVVPKRPAVALAFDQDQEAGLVGMIEAPDAVSGQALALGPETSIAGFQCGAALDGDGRAVGGVVGDAHAAPWQVVKE